MLSLETMRQNATIQQQKPLIAAKKRFVGLADQAADDVSGLDPAADQSLGALTARLRKAMSPAGHMDLVANQAGAANDSFDTAEAGLMARNRYQGGDDSYLAGERANIESARAAALTGARNTASTAARQEGNDSSQLLFSLLNQLRTQGFGREMGALGAATGVDQFLMSAEEQAAAREQARRDAAQARQSNLFGQLGQGLLSAFAR
jgi:hypothetical protein